MAKDSYMSYSTTHFSYQTWPAAQNYHLLNTDMTCESGNNIAHCNKVNEFSDVIRLWNVGLMPDNAENGQNFVKIVLKSIISVSER